MSKRDSAVSNWCFTLNNYTEYDYEHLKDIECSYMIIGKEHIESGTPHLQGFIQLKNRKRLTAMKKLNGKAHWEQCNGTPEQNIKYCSKEDKDPFIKGELREAGGVSRLNAYREKINACSTWSEVLDIPGIQGIMTYAKECWNNRPLEPMENFVPNEFQKIVLNIIEQPPDDRIINYIYDPKGGIGKSYLCKYLKCNMGACYLRPAKNQDLAHAYNGETIIVYDIPRNVDVQFINWNVIEQIKDGAVFSGKYDSAIKMRKGGCHLFIFSNQPYEDGTFSTDRMNIIDCTQMEKPNIERSLNKSSAPALAHYGGRGVTQVPPSKIAEASHACASLRDMNATEDNKIIVHFD